MKEETECQEWRQRSHRVLGEALAAVSCSLQRFTKREAEELGIHAEGHEIGLPIPLEPDTALERLLRVFELTPFEAGILLLCAGFELDPHIAEMCAESHGGPAHAYPSFGLAFSVLPGAHWSAISPASPLRYWRLLEVGAGHALMTSPLRIDERILCWLTGQTALDYRLDRYLAPVSGAVNLVPSHVEIVEQVAAALAETDPAVRPTVQLVGGDGPAKREIAACACMRQGRALWAVLAESLPANAEDLDRLIRLWEREAVLNHCALLLDCETLDSLDAARTEAVAMIIERLRSPLLVTAQERRRPRERAVFTLEVMRPKATEQEALWVAALGPAAPSLKEAIGSLTAQFNLGQRAVAAAASKAKAFTLIGGEAIPEATLWHACRMQARSRLDDLAQRIEGSASWADLVLPPPQRQILQDIVAHVRRRHQVYGEWGFASRGTRGLGISALFAGASGTGKTTAAEVMADELSLDLYRIDLSAVVSKYIGETEKNLRRVFDAAEEGGVILLFDEADALFGKRSEVKDSHDRHANIEVSYLLQRMESYCGLAILTTNMKNALDTAFLRRLRFVVQFPFPGAEERTEIWRRIFPPTLPTEGLDYARLAQWNVAGGNIRNTALNAAFLAAEAGEPVQMRHILRAAQCEYAKLEKPLTDAEVEGWI